MPTIILRHALFQCVKESGVKLGESAERCRSAMVAEIQPEVVRATDRSGVVKRLIR
jgi:hypothetical protein